jgi:hypothetical protein
MRRENILWTESRFLCFYLWCGNAEHYYGDPVRDYEVAMRLVVVREKRNAGFVSVENMNEFGH